jgi:hypothetical protein
MTPIGNKTNIPFIGIINLENTSKTIVAIANRVDNDNVTSGELFDASSLNSIARLTKDKIRFPATGALAVWKNENGDRLLLVGRQDVFISSPSSGYTYGYMELNITEGIRGNFDEPGLNSVSTVNDGDNGKYKSSLGKYPVNFIIQSPEADGSRIVFASTQKEGVYSYREREDDNWSWNAEQ